MSTSNAKWLIGSLTLVSAGCSQTPEEQLAEQWPLLDRYCTECHSDAERAGELTFEGSTPADVAAHPEIFERVVRRLRGSVMPPPGSPHPGVEEAAALVVALETALDSAAEVRGNSPGAVELHRLNRAEYASAVRDLVGLEVDANRLLPPDVSSDGFDNVAELLRVSPTYLDQFIAAAREVAIKAVGNPAPAPARAEYLSKVKNHSAPVEGLPLGTRDGLVVEHYFPADGEYVFNLGVSSEP